MSGQIPSKRARWVRRKGDGKGEFDKNPMLFGNEL